MGNLPPQTKIDISSTCIAMAKDVLEISTHANRDDLEGATLQFSQMEEKLHELKELFGI